MAECKYEFISKYDKDTNKYYLYYISILGKGKEDGNVRFYKASI